MRAAYRGTLRSAIVGLFLAALASAASAQSPTVNFFNQYFLPAGSGITGMGALIFTVLVPFLIVAILLYEGLNMFLERRPAAALGVLIALFIIPSGGYKIISGLFMSAFGLGTGVGTGVGPVASLIPGGSIQNPALIAAFVTFLGGMVAFQKLSGSGDLGGFELVGSMTAAAVAFFAFGGAIGPFIEVFAWLLVLAIGWEIFQTGMFSDHWPGVLVGGIGIVIVLQGLTSAVTESKAIPSELKPITTVTGTVETIVSNLTAAFLELIALVAVGAVGGYLGLPSVFGTSPDKGAVMGAAAGLGVWAFVAAFQLGLL